MRRIVRGTTMRLLYHLIRDRIQSDAIHKPTSSMDMFCNDVIGIRAIDDEMP